MDAIDERAVRTLAMQMGPEADVVFLYQSLQDRTARAEIYEQYLECTSNRGLASKPGPTLRTYAAPSPVSASTRAQMASSESEPEPELKPEPELEPEPEMVPESKLATQPGARRECNDGDATGTQVELIPRVTSDRTHQRLTGSIGTLSATSTAVSSTKRHSILSNQKYRITGQSQKPLPFTN